MSALTQVLLWALLALLASAFLYQARIALHGLRVRSSNAPQTGLRFAIVVPAHNEEAVIGKLLDSLRRLDYPKDKLHVLVVADHCTDTTAHTVRQAGYACLDRRTGERGKAPSLTDGIAWVNANHPEVAAVAFFDADNIVHTDFFRVMAGVVADEPCLQAHVGIHNWNASIFSRLNYINAMVENRFRELARSQAKLSCHLRGHGMVFRRDILQDLAWQRGAQVEDYDMQLRLVLSGRRVVWVDQARVDSVLPETAKQAAAQRLRWAGGKSAILRRSVATLFRRWLENRSAIVFDQTMLFLIPSHAVQLCLVFAVVIGAVLAAGFGSALLWTSLLLLVLYFGYFVIGAALNGVRLVTFMSVPAAPVYILWRTWIYLASLRGSARWR